MNIILLVFFALPIAVIIISIALQKILKCPLLVASIIFAIFLIVAVVLNNVNIFVLAVVYAVLAYLSAIISCIISRFLRDNPLFASCSNCFSGDSNGNNNDINSGITALAGTIAIQDDAEDESSCSCNRCNSDAVALANSTNSSCSCNSNNSNTIVAQANIIPNSNTNGRTGAIRGCYRRR